MATCRRRPRSRRASAIPTAPLHVPTGDNTVAEMPAPPNRSLVSSIASSNTSACFTSTRSALMSAKARTGKGSTGSVGEGDGGEGVGVAATALAEGEGERTGVASA